MGRLFDIFVLIFCNSTASRLIYAYSHYNMCAGGGCMYQISNEKFGLFVTELRKKKNLTQKDLAEKLYVSDKTVSKWERGLSMPNVVLLIPIADILDVTVTELLRGEKIDTQKNIEKKEIEEYSKRDGRIQLIRQKNAGSGAARNNGIKDMAR